jgi:hypothetical protein
MEFDVVTVRRDYAENQKQFHIECPTRVSFARSFREQTKKTRACRKHCICSKVHLLGIPSNLVFLFHPVGSTPKLCRTNELPEGSRPLAFKNFPGESDGSFENETSSQCFSGEFDCRRASLLLVGRCEAQKIRKFTLISLGPSRGSSGRWSGAVPAASPAATARCCSRKSGLGHLSPKPILKKGGVHLLPLNNSCYHLWPDWFSNKKTFNYADDGHLVGGNRP